MLTLRTQTIHPCQRIGQVVLTGENVAKIDSDTRNNLQLAKDGDNVQIDIPPTSSVFDFMFHDIVLDVL